MKVLSILNVSNADDLECDSGVIYQRLLAPELARLGLDYVVVGPDSPAFERTSIGGARKLRATLGTTRFESRFAFEWRSFSNLLEREAPDVIFSNQIESAAALKSLLVTLGATTTRLVSYCHFPPVRAIENGVPVLEPSLDIGGLGSSVLLQTLSALTASDAVVTQSEFAKNLLVSAARYHRVASVGPIHVVPPPADPLLLEPTRRDVAPRARDVLYNHRLYASYGTEQLIAWLSECEGDFTTVIANPMAHRSAARRRFNASPEALRDALARLPSVRWFTRGNERMAYRNAILGCRVGLAAPRTACPWSMAAVDCMGLGVPVIAPRYAAYPELVPSFLTFDPSNGPKELLDRLLDDDAFWLSASHACHAFASGLHPRAIASRLATILRGERLACAA